LKLKIKKGKNIYLTNERWKHICIEHPNISNNLEYIKKTIIGPLKISNSKYDENVKFYYNYMKDKKSYLLVSVKYLNGEGFVITSFFTKRIEK